MSIEGTILVTGATGKQGGAVARELLAAGHKVRAMTRKPQSDAARELGSLGAEVVAGDLDDPGSLRGPLRGVWGVFAVQNTWEAGVEREEEQGKRFAHAARDAGVRHYVYTSVASAHRNTGIPHFDNKWRVEETVRSLDFPSHVIIRPVFFMENFLAPDHLENFHQGKAGELRMALREETPLQMIAVADVGKYGRIAFERSQELNRREIDIAGDEKTMRDATANLSEGVGHTIAFQPVDIEQIRSFSEDYAIMLEWFDRQGYDVDIEATAREYGVTPTSFSDWCREQRKALSRGRIGA